MYGLKEAAILAYDQLKDNLAKYGYTWFKHTPVMWHHTTWTHTFTLAVNEFRIEYLLKQDSNHLLSALKDKYSIAIDWSGDSYLGLNINWQYNKGYVEISMPDYMPKALAKFKHPPPCLPQHAPHAWTAPVYWKKAQYDTEDRSPFFDKHATTRLLAISGTFLYYARAVDPTILPALNELQISNPNPQKKHPKLANNWWITYLPILSNFWYYASNMILSLIYDAGFFVWNLLCK